MTDQPPALPLAPAFTPRLLRRNSAWTDVGVIDVLTLERLDDLLFRNQFNQGNINGSLFGGQVLSQALAAACGTVVAERPPHSLHGYFLRAGQSGLPVIFKVERTRDGGSFSTRRVVAVQNGEPILHMECSFHRPEGGLDLQQAAPDVPPPEQLTPLGDLLRAHADSLPPLYVERFSELGPFELKPTDPAQVLGLTQSPRRSVWMRLPGLAASDNPVMHQLALVYLSDFWLAATPVSRHVPMSEVGSAIRISSLNHAVWFHRPLRVDDWLLYDTDSPSLSNGTGLSRGLLYDRAGTLVATVSQEALYRKAGPRPT